MEKKLQEAVRVIKAIVLGMGLGWAMAVMAKMSRM
jgi:hypothetical protein